MDDEKLNKGKVFTQVTRTNASVENVLDPLSAFMSEPVEKIEEKPKQKNGLIREAFNNISSIGLDVYTELLSGEKRKSNNSLLSDYDSNQSIDKTTNRMVKTSSFDNATSQLKNNNQSPRSEKYLSGTRTLSQSQSQSPIITTTVLAVNDEHISKEVESIPLLTGEQRLITLADSHLFFLKGIVLSGVLNVTNYRVAFVPPKSQLHAVGSVYPQAYSMLNIPLSCIERVEKERKSRESRYNGITIVIHCKDVRVLRITIRGNRSLSDLDIERAIGVMMAYAFPNNLTHLFAFSHTLISKTYHIQENLTSDLTQEYYRLGILDDTGSDQWRITLANKDYKLCDTYPNALVIPKKITDDELYISAAFRSGQRLPVLSWGDKNNGATLWRSSQPKAGVSGSCSTDEKYLDIIAKSCIHRRGITQGGITEPILHIVDCRPRTSAMANRAAGAGYESQANYPNARLDFYNIGNIHVMRDSHKNLCNVVLNSNQNDINFSKQLEDTQWLSHVRLVLKASWETANFISKGMPVLVHCSHGWDRTSQVCSLAELFLDSYYRTIDGFRILIDKEWCSFGHQFHLRAAHTQDKNNRQDDQISPIFLQFIECTWQIVKQYPTYFEFNLKYLLVIADHIYSGRFGNFLFNSDLDREAYGSKNKCADIWTYIHYNRPSLTNPFYMDEIVFLPPLSLLLRNISIWTDYYYRWSSVPSILTPPEPYHKYISLDGNCIPEWYESEIFKDKFEEIPKNIDLEISAMITYDSFWEAIYRKERQSNNELVNEIEELRNSYKLLDRSSDLHSYGIIESNDHANHRDEQIADYEKIIEQQQDIIDSLALALKQTGYPTNELDDILTKVIEKVPALGESITEGTIASWTKKIGDKVNVDDVIAIVETDKVTVDIKSTLSGVLTNVFATDNVIVGNDFYEIDTDLNAPISAAVPIPIVTSSPTFQKTNNPSKSNHSRIPRIKFIEKLTVKSSTINKTQVKEVKEGKGVDFMTLKGGAQYGRPKLSAKEIEAIESGVAMY
eukprot:gene17038-22546_t